MLAHTTPVAVNGRFARQVRPLAGNPIFARRVGQDFSFRLYRISAILHLQAPQLADIHLMDVPAPQLADDDKALVWPLHAVRRLRLDNRFTRPSSDNAGRELYLLVYGIVGMFISLLLP